MGEDGTTRDGESEEFKAVDIGEGGGSISIKNSIHEGTVANRGGISMSIENSMIGSLDMQGEYTYIDEVVMIGRGRTAVKLSDTTADILNLVTDSDHRYGIHAENSVFNMRSSRIKGRKYDLKFGRGVIADLYDVEAEEIADVARGKRRVVQDEVISELYSTTDKQLRLEEIYYKIGRIISLIQVYYTLEGLADWV